LFCDVIRAAIGILAKHSAAPQKAFRSGEWKLLLDGGKARVVTVDGLGALIAVPEFTSRAV
jgi:hypothetical protein